MLTIEPISKSHIAFVYKNASDKKISDTSNVPHPYTMEMADEWFKAVSSRQEAGVSKVFAVIFNKKFVGVISLNNINPESKIAELDYWVSVKHQGKGFATSAIAQTVSYAKQTLGIKTIYSGCLAKNKASIAVQQKNGFEPDKTYQLAEGKFAGEEYIISKLKIA